MQKISNKFMNTKVREFCSHGLLGGIWIIVGILRLLSPTIPLLLFLIFFLVVALLGQLMAIFLQSELRDEMTKFHEQKAFTTTMLLGSIVILVFTMFSTLKQPCMVNFSAIFPFILGFSNLLYYLIFMYLETYGD